MNLLTLSAKDLRRRPTRSVLTIAGVAIASATLISLLGFNKGYDISLNQEMSDSGIHMLVSTEGCPTEAASLALHGGEIPKFLPESRVPAIRAVAGVRVATGILIFALQGEGRRTDLFYGIDEDFQKLKPHWRIKGGWFENDQSIVLGAEAAFVEKRDVGDKIYFPEIDTEFTVTGVLERTGSEDDGWFYLPLKTAQRVFKKDGKLTGVAVNVNDIDRVDQVKSEIERLPDVYVVTAREMIEQILKLVGSSKSLMFAVLGIALVIASLGVLNTVLMSVMEKLREFGYMRCIGAAPSHVFRIVLFETVILCAIGGVLGVITGWFGSSIADRIIRDLLPYAPSGKLVMFDFETALATVAVAIGIGALAGLYPSWKASHVPPMEAIRNE